jgi:6-phosphogluconolactonase
MSKSLLFTGGSNRKVGWLPHANSPGISCFSFDEETGAAELLSVTGGVDNPTFLSVSPDGRLLAATSEMPDWDEGIITLYRITGSGLEYVNKQATRGDSTAHNSFHPTEPLIAIANYSGRPGAKSVALFPVGELLSLAASEVLHEGNVGPNERQDRPHPHCARWSPNWRFLVVPDLGLDTVFVYRLEGGRLVHHGSVALPPGSGPRHIAFHPRLPFAYLANELASTVATLAWDAGSGTLSVVAVNPALGEPTGAYLASGILVTPNGRHALVGNRGERSSVGRLAIDAATGVATLIGNTPLDGWPRDLVMSASGRIVAVSNQERERFDLFRYHPETGELTPLPSIAVGTPTCAVFVPPT